MKILQINKLYYPWIGGVEKVVQQIAEGLTREDGFKIEVLCCQSKGKRSIEEINGVKICRASSFGLFWGMPISFGFFRLFKKKHQEVDIIDFHHPFFLGDLANFLFKPKAKIIIHYHSDIVRQKILNFLLKPLTFNTLNRAQKIIVSNQNLLENSPYLKRFKEKCEIIPFGVDLKLFENYNKKEVETLKNKYGSFILFVGRINYYKGLEYLIEAMKKVEVNLVIIGDGPLKEKLENMVKELKILGKIFFLPTTEEKELVNYYNACQAFVLPSIFKSEAFGLALVEAMACGKPVVSTELGTGTSFINKDGITGFVVPPKNSESLARAIRKIVTDDKMAEELGENAFARIKEEFSLEKMIKKTVLIYQNI